LQGRGGFGWQVIRVQRRRGRGAEIDRDERILQPGIIEDGDGGSVGGLRGDQNVMNAHPLNLILKDVW
jgi:hypothetical protein